MWVTLAIITGFAYVVFEIYSKNHITASKLKYYSSKKISSIVLSKLKSELSVKFSYFKPNIRIRIDLGNVNIRKISDFKGQDATVYRRILFLSSFDDNYVVYGDYFECFRF